MWTSLFVRVVDVDVSGFRYMALLFIAWYNVH